MKNLECSSRGDKRFSAMYAIVEVFDRPNTIEKHYQNCKVNAEGDPCKKGEKVALIIIKGIKLDPSYLTAWYKLLWIKYLDQHPELVEYADTFDTFSDMFRGKAINCQADVIGQYVKFGRREMMKDTSIQKLLSILSGGTKE